MSEQWRPVIGYEGLYEVSDLGRVRSLARQTSMGARGGRVLKPNPLPKGYLAVTLSRPPNVKRRVAYVHTLVLEAFVGPRPPGMDACHSPDPTPANCRLDNLRWDTRRNNFADKRQHGTQTRGGRHPQALLTEEQAAEILASSESGSALARRFGVTQSTVSAIRRGKNWKHLQGAAK